MKKNATLLGGLSAASVFLLVSFLHTHVEEPKLQMREDETSMGTKEDPEARLRYEWMMLRDPITGQIPKDIRRKELEFARTLPTREQLSALNKNAGALAANWLSRGPWNVGGRTRALAVDAANVNHLLAGGVSGGMWSSDDGGTTWAKTTALANLHSVTCIAQDTRTGQTATWYYGTGEALGNSTSGGGAFFAGYGIFKSANNGASWTRLPVDNGDPQGFDRAFDFVWNIVVNPTNGHVYAAVLGAIYRSTDSGTTWSLVLGGTGTINTTMCTDIQVTATGRLYATGSSNGPMAGIWTSTTGASGGWTPLTPTGGLPTTYARIVVGLALSNENSIYFLLGPASGQPSTPANHRIWKYDATGGTWSTRIVPALGGQTGEFDSQGSYDLLIKVKPDNENTVIIGGTNLFLSTNGFSSGTPNWIGGYTSANTSYASYPNHHADQHSFVFIPGGSIAYSGHDGGISKTTNILAGTVAWTFLNNGYLTTQCYTVALDHATSGSNNILTGLQDNGVWIGSSALGTATWTSEFGGDGAYVAFSNGATSRYVSSQNGNTYRLFGANLFARVDPGGTNYLFINPFILDPNNSSIMYMANGTVVIRCSDVTALPQGGTPPSATLWPQLSGSTPTTPSASISALAVSNASPANRLYVGSSAGDVKKIDGANTSNPAGVEIGASLPSGNISCIAVDPTNGDKVLVVFSNYNVVSLHYTVNGGTNWTNVEGNLAGTVGPSCRYAAIVPFNGTTTFYVGTSVGLYSTTSLNGTSTVWAQEGSATIGSVVVTFVDARTVDGVVIAGTHANGVYSNSGTTGGQTVNVYSGDANNDAVCDIRDILPIGRFYGSTGPARTGGSLTWGQQTATVWSPTEATYADCDGNGTVNATDVQGIINNYSLTHSSPPETPVDRIAACTALLRQIDSEPTLSGPMKEIRSEIISYMRQTLGISFNYTLAQNYPNPFNPSTTIKFTIPEYTAKTQVRIYDIAGKLVWEKTLNNVPVGNHEVVWNGESTNGTKTASGMYIYKLTAGNFSAAKRMLMIK